MAAVDTKVYLSGLELKNPIIPASGTFGYGYEATEFYDINKLGSISLKGTTRKPQNGNPLPRIAEYSSGMINAVGLENHGIHWLVEEGLPKLADVFDDKVIANISGDSIENYVYCCELVNQCDSVGIIEVNVSCPNVDKGKLLFGVSTQMVGELIRAIKSVTTKPIYVKLTPNDTNIVDIAATCAMNGADGLVLINTLKGMRIDLKTHKPILSNTIGGCSGPAIFPVALRMVYDVYKEKLNIPIIGVGGITNPEDVMEMMLAGADAVQIGTANLIDPWACEKIVDALPEVMEEYKVKSLRKIVGGAHNG